MLAINLPLFRASKRQYRCYSTFFYLFKYICYIAWPVNNLTLSQLLTVGDVGYTKHQRILYTPCIKEVHFSLAYT